ncbi:phosphonates transport system permease protein [Stappia aggregata IAM 12614]|uniref:Phosphonates transport system permease protein n=1 Tax=Roseibium aggregatum (strain ATCC 25650 / DSM 13394 / JCM 20685 / NBRC 16684 / NCIMB 2208 / IAM 12614 / B1) TaxID=384765 RepID=A0P2W0_ROSAI|nr:phosphonate ABC transporter, permease protein PhnE [Roseibium aggregatum]EAV40569.1 phosphonates transport system permease protein [Stappia aggregata IAM 12614] [Roseibium aggregatum IAM 12614]
MTAPTPDIARARALVPDAFTTPRRTRFIQLASWTAFLLLTGWCLWDFGFAPDRLLQGATRFGDVLAFMFPPHIWTSWAEWKEILKGLGETVAMAFMGTLLGAVIAFPLAFLGAKNILPLSWLRLGVRRGFDALRAIEQLILALIFIRAFGLGPLAGILAIAVSEIGTFSKLFSEAIENTSQKPAEGVRASGGGNLQTIRFAVLPQALPVILSIILYNFESNTRTGTILGIVGAGGIGFLLADRIQAYRWPEAWTIIFLIIVVVYLIDGFSGFLRRKIIGGESGRA